MCLNTFVNLCSFVRRYDFSQRSCKFANTPEQRFSRLSSSLYLPFRQKWRTRRKRGALGKQKIRKKIFLFVRMSTDEVVGVEI